MKRKTDGLCLLVMIAVVAIPAFASPADLPMIWKDKFDDNSQKWAVGENESIKVEVREGLYRLTTKKPGGDLQAYPIRIDRNKNYSLETELRWAGADYQGGVGIIWDLKDVQNFYVFVISPQGGYSILKFKDGNRIPLVDWEANIYVRKNDLFNRLEVRKTGKNLEFFLNEHKVHQVPYETFSGDNVGFLGMSAVALEVDVISLRAEKEYQGERLGVEADAQAFFESAFRKHAAPWLDVTGSLTGRWDDTDTTNPGYVLEQTSRGSLSIVAHEFGFDLSKDFAVETRLRKLSGDDDSGYSLILDRRGNSFLIFSIAGAGYYSIARYSSGRRTEIVKWTKDPNVNLYESSNTLGVYRRGTRLLFAVNGRKVFEQVFEGWSSTLVGFGLGGSMCIKPESLAIYRKQLTEGALIGTCVDGFGCYVFGDGSRYIGSWKEGLPEGLGTWYRAGGLIEEGFWDEGRLVSGLLPHEKLFYPIVTKAGDYGLVDEKGGNATFGLAKLFYLSKPVKGRQLVLDGKRVAFLDPEGKKIASGSWSLETDFAEGLALIRGAGNGIGLLDDSGKIVVNPGSYVFDPLSPPGYGVILFKDRPGSDGLYGIMGRDGTVVVPASYSNIQPFREGLARVQRWQNDDFGFIDRSGNWRIKPTYSRVSDFSEGLAYFSNSTTEGFIDTKGEVAFSQPYEAVYLQSPYMFKEGLLAFFDKKINKAGYIDKTGKVVIEPEFDRAKPFSEGFAAFNRGGSPKEGASWDLLGGWGFIDYRGRMTIPPTFERVEFFSNGLAAASENDKWGFIDKLGSWVIDPIYIKVYPFTSEGFAQVNTAEGYWTWIDRTGKEIWRE